MGYLNVENKLIFIHLIKTGGTSIQSVLENYAPNDLTYFGHTQTMPEKIARRVMKNLPFRLQKNSIAKLRRLYNFRSGHMPIKSYLDVVDEKFIEIINIAQYNTFTVVRDPWEVMGSLFFYQKRKFKGTTFPTFDEFVKHRCRDIRIEDQFEFLSDNSGRICVNNILRFETLEDDWRIFLTKINGLSRNLPYKNAKSGKKNFYKEFYSKRSMELVKSKYWRDIETFGYTFDE